MFLPGGLPAKFLVPCPACAGWPLQSIRSHGRPAEPRTPDRARQRLAMVPWTERWPLRTDLLATAGIPMACALLAPNAFPTAYQHGAAPIGRSSPGSNFPDGFVRSTCHTCNSCRGHTTLVSMAMIRSRPCRRLRAARRAGLHASGPSAVRIFISRLAWRSSSGVISCRSSSTSTVRMSFMDPTMASSWFLSRCHRWLHCSALGRSAGISLLLKCLPWTASWLSYQSPGAVLAVLNFMQPRSTLRNPVLRIGVLRGLLIVCRLVGADIFKECKQSFKHAYLFNNGRSNTGCLLIVGILVCCGFLASGLNANPNDLCAVSPLASPNGTCLSCGEGLRQAYRHSLCRFGSVAKSQGKRELRILPSPNPTTLKYLSKASELGLLLDHGVKPFRCLFFAHSRYDPVSGQVSLVLLLVNGGLGRGVLYEDPTEHPCTAPKLSKKGETGTSRRQ